MNIEQIAQLIDEDKRLVGKDPAEIQAVQQEIIDLLTQMMETKSKKFWSDNLKDLAWNIYNYFENPDEILEKYNSSENPHIRNRAKAIIINLRKAATFDTNINK